MCHALLLAQVLLQGQKPGHAWWCSSSSSRWLADMEASRYRPACHMHHAEDNPESADLQSAHPGSACCTQLLTYVMVP